VACWATVLLVPRATVGFVAALGGALVMKNGLVVAAGLLLATLGIGWFCAVQVASPAASVAERAPVMAAGQAASASTPAAPIERRAVGSEDPPARATLPVLRGRVLGVDGHPVGTCPWWPARSLARAQHRWSSRWGPAMGRALSRSRCRR
jgi:hypothetical protein